MTHLLSIINNWFARQILFTEYWSESLQTQTKISDSTPRGFTHQIRDKNGRR